MSVLTKAEFMEKLKAVIGEKNDDETLSFIEDANDTLDEKKKVDDVDWQKKYEDNDKEWREKYKKRFFEDSGNNEPNDVEKTEIEEEDSDPPKIEKFDDLFDTKKE